VLRFQLGIVAVVLLVWLVVRALTTVDASVRAERATSLVGYLVGGGAVLGLQGLLDVALGYGFLGTPSPIFASTSSIARSSGPPLVHLSADPRPADAAAADALARESNGAGGARAPAAHSGVGHVRGRALAGAHKEDRFLFPIVPFLLVLLGAALAELWRTGRSGRIVVASFWH